VALRWRRSGEVEKASARRGDAGPIARSVSQMWPWHPYALVAIHEWPRPFECRHGDLQGLEAAQSLTAEGRRSITDVWTVRLHSRLMSL
jgi:hypothetical protein